MISEIYLNKKNIEKEINSLEISRIVSKVAAIPKIRKEMVKIQRDVDRNNGVVMDGRDIGSIVFPDADIKLFLTASSRTLTLNVSPISFMASTSILGNFFPTKFD